MLIYKSLSFYLFSYNALHLYRVRLLGNTTTQVPKADISMLTSLQECGMLSDTSRQIVEKREELHTLQLVDALLSRAVWRAVPGSELTHSSGTLLQTPTAQDCPTRHSWISTAGWQLQLPLEAERERAGLCHTNMRGVISAVGRHKEEGILNTRDLTGLIGLVEILLPLASLSFSQHCCSKLKWEG